MEEVAGAAERVSQESLALPQPVKYYFRTPADYSVLSARQSGSSDHRPPPVRQTSGDSSPSPEK